MTKREEGKRRMLKAHRISVASRLAKAYAAKLGQADALQAKRKVSDAVRTRDNGEFGEVQGRD